MFKADPAALGVYFDEKLQRGAVLRIEDYPFLSEPVRRPKFFVVLNRDCAQPEIYHFLTTSKAAKYKTLSFHSFGVSIPAGVVDCLTAEETIVDCFRLMPTFRRAFLLEQLCAKGISIYQPLPAAFMEQIDNIIRRSRTISPTLKALIT
ncbi:MAG: hypothetical protein AAB152_02200 [Candidatus Coatesbacteria bacterium]